MSKKTKEIEAEIVEKTTVILAPFKDLDLTEGIDLVELMKMYAEVPEIDPEAENAGELYQYVLKGHKSFVTARTRIEKVRKALKAPALAFGKDVDSRAKALAFSIYDKEIAFFIQRKKVEDNEQRKQDEVEAIERDRVSGIRSIMEAMQGLPFASIGATSTVIGELVSSMEIPEEAVYAEFTAEAIGYYKTVMEQLEVQYETAVKAENADRIQAEVEADRVKAEAVVQAEIAKEREDFQREKAEFEAEKRASLEAKALEEAERNAEEQEKAELAQSEKDVAEALQAMEIAKDKTDDEFYDAYSNGGLDSVLKTLYDNKFTHVRWEV